MAAALANFLFFSNISCFFLLPLHIQALGGSEAEIGLIMGIYSAAAIVLQPLVGGWVDRFGRRPFQVAGATLITFASLAFALAERLSPLFSILRILQGIGHATFFVANYAFVADLVPAGRRGQALGIFGLSGLVSMAISPMLGELLIPTFGFRTFFLTAAVIGLAALLVTLRLSEKARPTGSRLPRWSLNRLLSLATLTLLPLLLGGSFGVSYGTLFTFVPTYGKALGIPSLAFFYVSYTLCALLVRTVGGRLMDRLGPRTILAPALGLITLGGMLLASLSWFSGAASAVGLVLVGALAGTAHGFVYPALTVYLMTLAPEDQRGEVLGLFGAVTIFGGGAGAIVFGYVIQAVGYPIMFLLLAFLLGSSAALALRLDR